MSFSWPDPLVTALARRRVVILIGSGVSANARSDVGAAPPTWGVFLRLAYERLGKRIAHISNALKRYAYLEACDYLKSEYGSNWESFIREQFVTPAYKPADIHKAIFDLDCRIVASLNFDKIYDTYAITASENTVIIKNYYDADVRQVVAGSDRYIIKPHGTVDAISKMIFTLNDYGKARITSSSFYEMMTALLHTHTFLCVGCGLSDPDMQLIFEDYKYKHNESPHFILLPSPITSAEKNLVRDTRGLNVLEYSSRDGHRELTDQLFALGGLVGTKREAIAELQNW